MRKSLVAGAVVAILGAGYMTNEIKYVPKMLDMGTAAQSHRSESALLLDGAFSGEYPWVAGKMLDGAISERALADSIEKRIRGLADKHPVTGLMYEILHL